MLYLSCNFPSFLFSLPLSLSFSPCLSLALSCSLMTWQMLLTGITSCQPYSSLFTPLPLFSIHVTLGGLCLNSSPAFIFTVSSACHFKMFLIGVMLEHWQLLAKPKVIKKPRILIILINSISLLRNSSTLFCLFLRFIPSKLSDSLSPFFFLCFTCSLCSCVNDAVSGNKQAI